MNFPVGHIGQSAKATVNLALGVPAQSALEKQGTASQDSRRPRNDQSEFAALFAGMPDQMPTADTASGAEQQNGPREDARAVSVGSTATAEPNGGERAQSDRFAAEKTEFPRSAQAPVSAGSDTRQSSNNSGAAPFATPHSITDAKMTMPSEGTETLDENGTDGAIFGQMRRGTGLPEATIEAKPEYEQKSALTLPSGSGTTPLQAVPSVPDGGVTAEGISGSAQSSAALASTGDASALQNTPPARAASSFAQIVGQTFLHLATNSTEKPMMTDKEAALGEAARLHKAARSKPAPEPQLQRSAGDIGAPRELNQTIAPPSNPTTPQPASPSGLTLVKADAGSFTTDIQSKIEGAHSLLASSDTPEVFNWDTARAAIPPTGTTGLRADLTPHIARQLVDVMAQAAHRPTEIALSPQELGRVRMSVVAEDGAITVSIIAERPETLDLMRRHIDQLGQTFKSMGYESISFAFGQGADSGDHAGSGSGGDPSSGGQQATATPDESTIIHLDAAPARGVDVRL